MALNFDLDFQPHIDRLAEAYDKKLSKPRMRVYFDELKDLDQADFAAACSDAKRTSTYFPAIADLLDRARDAKRVRLERTRAETPSPFVTVGRGNNTLAVRRENAGHYEPWTARADAACRFCEGSGFLWHSKRAPGRGQPIGYTDFGGYWPCSCAQAVVV